MLTEDQVIAALRLARDIADSLLNIELFGTFDRDTWELDVVEEGAALRQNVEGLVSILGYRIEPITPKIDGEEE